MAYTRNIPLKPEEIYLVSCCLKQIFDDLKKEGEVYRGKKLKNLQVDEDEYEMLKMLQVKF